MNSREVIRKLKKDGWYEVNQVGSHKQFKHPVKAGRVTVPHPKRDGPERYAQKHRKTSCDKVGLVSEGTTMEYIAYLHKDRGSDFGVSFSDFPGCVTAGRTLDEARRLAPEALALHIEGMIEDGAPVPEASTIDDLAGDPALKGAVAFLVKVDVHEKAERFNITARKSQMEEIDRLAEREGMTRSAYIVRSALAGKSISLRNETRTR